MTAKATAKKIVKKFHEHSYNPNPLFNTKEDVSHDKDCALIAVDMVINAIKQCSVVAGYPLDEWEEVKKEIQLL